MSNDLQIIKSNHLVEASYRLSVAEQRVVLACIAQVRRDEPVTDEILYSVSATEVAELAGTDVKTAYRDLAAAAERLFDRRVTILREPDGTDRPARKRLTRWVQTVDYVPGEGRIELRFSKDILPFLTELSANFTRYALADVAKMTSSHAIRLFELITQWGSVGQREISIEQLRAWFQLDSRYPLMADLRRWVIEPAVEQINTHTPLKVKWEQRKTGRKITHLVFTFKAKPPKRVNSNKPKTNADIAALARPGETWEQLRARLGVAKVR